MPNINSLFPQRRALITGACSGLGLALAQALAGRGWNLALIDTDENARVLSTISASGANILFQAMDVRDVPGWQDMRTKVEQAWGGLDLLINNAGIGDAGTIFTTPPDRWAKVLDINIMGLVHGTAAFAPVMRDAGGGHVVNVASMAGLFAMPGMMAYNVSKAGVVSFSETLAAELHPYKIGVSCVCPHFFKTQIGASMAPHASPKTLAYLKRQMDQAQITAAQVAQKVIEGVEADKFLIFTHPGSARQWWMKRLWPTPVLRTAKRQAQRLSQA